ncbi:hypothetical protein HMPREF9069_01377 [Atopobium sp. oral taxon 810 str. F0209]|nr:hypothetical protein HMPREF9069_01377 [Atopobium sp. oral taxon 810 str. F0209]
MDIHSPFFMTFSSLVFKSLLRLLIYQRVQAAVARLPAAVSQ